MELKHLMQLMLILFDHMINDSLQLTKKIIVLEIFVKHSCATYECPCLKPWKTRTASAAQISSFFSKISLYQLLIVNSHHTISYSSDISRSSYDYLYQLFHDNVLKMVNCKQYTLFEMNQTYIVLKILDIH